MTHDELASMLSPEPTGILRMPVDQDRFAKYVKDSLDTVSPTTG